LKDYVSAGMYL